MSRRSPHNEDYDYDDDEFDDVKKVRRFKKEEKQVDKKKRWDRESYYDRNNDYDERR